MGAADAAPMLHFIEPHIMEVTFDIFPALATNFGNTEAFAPP